MRPGIIGEEKSHYLPTQKALDQILAGADAGAVLDRGGLLDALMMALPNVC
ncbi:hypothetical protein NMG46_21540 [Mesorhizobium sp. LMG 17147]|uniref:hypothetical protein n=1 Tax=Mesorhizobium sp. LMG 17147 TaxID=2963091 RepID=UPI0020C9F4C7|nr:hypothetical protein [Mesorhizobium sp. LMG 17147]MCP9232811.1 hypothetical protein [Mesorhizobium sp. LMG 17147]